MTPERLAEIEKRCAAATPGPWEIDTNTQTVWTEHDVSVATIDRHVLANWREDGPFIANARQDIPDLLAEVRRLQSSLPPLARPTDRTGRLVWGNQCVHHLAACVGADAGSR